MLHLRINPLLSDNARPSPVASMGSPASSPCRAICQYRCRSPDPPNSPLGSGQRRETARRRRSGKLLALHKEHLRLPLHCTGIVQVAASKSISSQVASRTSPERHAVNTKNVNANLVDISASQARTVSNRGRKVRIGERSMVRPRPGSRRQRLDDGRICRIGVAKTFRNRPSQHGPTAGCAPSVQSPPLRSRSERGSPAHRRCPHRPRISRRSPGTHRFQESSATRRPFWPRPSMSVGETRSRF